MKAQHFKVVAIVERYGEAVEKVISSGDCAIVERGGARRQLVMRCPDGCGEVLSINLDARSGPAWRAYRRGRQWTFYPSIDRSTGCKSHFILIRGDIFWCDWDEGGYVTSAPSGLADRILPLLGETPASYVDLADKLGEIPWDVLTECRALVRAERAIEEPFPNRGRFRTTT